MANEYDFKELTRNIESLNKRYEKFESQAESDLDKIINAKFNNHDYGSDVIEKKIKNMVRDCTREIERYYNSFINEIRRKSHSIREDLKAKARDIYSTVDSYNNVINKFNTINELYENGRIIEVISTADNMLTLYDSSSKEFKYILFLELESLDKYCRSKINDSSQEDLSYFEKYESLCKKYNAKAHYNGACILFGKYASRLLSNSNTLTTEEKYNLAYNGLVDLREMNMVEGEEALYNAFVSAFNELSENAYNSFNYLKIKQYLDSASLINECDIKNVFFRTRTNLVDKMFDYCKTKFRVADLNNIKLVINDTIQLCDKRTDYFEFWFGNYDNLPKQYLSYLLNCYENANSLRDFDSFVKVRNSLSENIVYLGGKEDIINELSKYYLDKVGETINLYSFVRYEVEFLSILSILKPTYGSESNQKISEVYKCNAKKLLPLIKKYHKELASYDDLSNLNNVYKEISIKLTNKTPKKKIGDTVNKISEVQLKEMIVKPMDFDKEKSKKKKIIIGSVIAAFIIITITVLIILFAK